MLVKYICNFDIRFWKLLNSSVIFENDYFISVTDHYCRTATRLTFDFNHKDVNC